jgi:hypothetical protein
VAYKQAVQPTQRAADGGYAARFLGSFLALSCSRFDGESTLPPTAANAHRWADKAEPNVVNEGRIQR